MLGVLRAFVADKNGASRGESRRRAAGSEWMYQGYRTWELDVWELKGPPESWDAQLEEHYKRQPVFALLSGIGSATWQPVHAFCERHELPALFPNVDAPLAGTDFYSLYFSRGAALEAEILARVLGAASIEKIAPIIQVYRAGSRGSDAAGGLRAALGDKVRDVAIKSGTPLAGALPPEAGAATWILWLDADDVKAFMADGERWPAARAIYVSASIAPPERLQFEDAARSKVRLVYPFDLPQSRALRLARAKAWFTARKIPVTDEHVQVNTFFTATVAGDALSHLATVHSRDLLVERIEHMASRQLNTTVYPRISLGPGQRYGSKGGFIVGLSGNALRPLAAETPWIVP
jgi:hypothetical protein